MADDNKRPPIQRFAEHFKVYGMYLGVVVASADDADHGVS